VTNNDLNEILDLLLSGYTKEHTMQSLETFLAEFGVHLLVETLKNDSDNCFKYLLTTYDMDVNSVEKNSCQSVLYKIIMFNSTKCLTSLVDLHKRKEVLVDSELKD